MHNVTQTISHLAFCFSLSEVVALMNGLQSGLDTIENIMCAGLSHCYHPTSNKINLSQHVLGLFYNSTVIAKLAKQDICTNIHNNTHKTRCQIESGSQIKTKVQLAAICKRMQIFTHTPVNNPIYVLLSSSLLALPILVSRAHKLHWSH